MVAPGLEHREVQQAVRAVEAEVGGELIPLARRLMLAKQHPVAVVNHVAQHDHTARLGNRAAAKGVGPGEVRRGVDGTERVADAVVAVLVLERVVVNVRSGDEGNVPSSGSARLGFRGQQSWPNRAHGKQTQQDGSGAQAAGDLGSCSFGT